MADTDMEPQEHFARSISAEAASCLEVYEGMPHVFQPFLADAPEGRAAWTEIAAFWTEHLS